MHRIAGMAAADMLRSPFDLGEGTRLADLFAAAGIREAQVRFGHGLGRFPSIRAIIEADLLGWLPFVGIVLGEDLIAGIPRQAEIVLQPFVTSDEGGVMFASPALLATAFKMP